MNDSSRPTLSLERFASLLAYVAHFGKASQAEVLDRNGVHPEMWRDSRRHWLARLSQADPKTQEAHAFGLLFARTALILDRQMPALSDIGPRASEAVLSSDEPMTMVAESLEPATIMRTDDLPSLSRSAAGVLARLPSATSAPKKGKLPNKDDELNFTMRSESSLVADLEAPPSAPQVSVAEARTATIEEAPRSSATIVKQPESRSVDATAFVMAPFMDRSFDDEPTHDPMSSTIFGAPAELDRAPNVSPSKPATPRPVNPPSREDPAAPPERMSPEHYARLAHATHLAPSVMRQRVHASLGITDESHRTRIDQAMTQYLSADRKAYNLYLQWVAYLRNGGT